ncbi:glycosyltransferase [bacterium]|nr:glycosyltransferase [bacterium]
MLNYNGLQYLKRTIKPLLNLDYPNCEFIVVDNGSADHSLAFIKKFKKIKLVNSPKKREKNFACNYGIEKSKGEYILLCDNDLLIRDSYLINDLIEYSNKLDSCGSISAAFFNEGEISTKGYGGFLGYYFTRETKRVKRDKLVKFDKQLIGYPSGIGIFLKRSTWDMTGGFDDSLKFGGDDNDLGIKLWLLGYKNYLYSKTSQMHIGMAERRDNKKYSLKWKEMFYAHLYTIFKNYRLKNLIPTFFLYSVFGFVKSIKQSLLRLNIGPLLAFFRGYYLFLKNLPHAIKKRKEMQSKRVVKDDIFLKIKPSKLFVDEKNN